MALERKLFSEIPPDAIILSEDEALKYQTRVLNTWKDPADILAYKYGSSLLGAASIFSGIYINNHFRTKFKLLHYGRVSSYLPICAVPAFFSFMSHQGLVLKELLVLKKEQCPICVELRASVLQAGTGCLLPLILAPISSIALVHKYATFNIPYITQPKEVYQIIKKQIKPIRNILFGILIGQALLASAVTYFEADSIYKVNLKLALLEQDLESRGVV